MKPLAGQFANVFDLVFKKDEDTLPIASVENLSDTLANKADKDEIEALTNQRQVLPAGTASLVVTAGTHIWKFFIKAPTAITLKIGTTEGGVEINLDPQDINVGWGVCTTDFYAAVDTTIYFGGVAGDTVITIFK